MGVQAVNEAEIRERLKKIVSSISRVSPPPEMRDDMDLFASGTLDSVVIVGLLFKIEDEFGIQVPPTEYHPENFMTLTGLTRMVHKIRSGGKPGPTG